MAKQLPALPGPDGPPPEDRDQFVEWLVQHHGHRRAEAEEVAASRFNETDTAIGDSIVPLDHVPPLGEPDA